MTTLMTRNFIWFAAATLLIISAFFITRPAIADDGVILTVSGKIAGGGKRDFTLEDLEKIGMTSFVSPNNWMEGTHKFEGVPFQKFLETVGAAGTSLMVVALNEYEAEIPMSAVKGKPALLVTRIDGETISVREKGPVWILYPQTDDYPDYKKPPFTHYMVWQLRNIDVR
ncbi:MAG: molybdopterin-dependent oxidoreductase [Rhodospirillales bacterium]|nr:molybdopterin-dependent oxidoreductase [Rhodospirillales bacterium]MBO6787295.1 molybdopterin-dependent oxidoreductase [Rhodospirillales bacterium]